MEPDLVETKRLLERARGGDKECERQLFTSLENLLRGEARRHPLMTVVRKRCTEDDVVHEVWLRFYSSGSFASFEPRQPGSLKAYLALILDCTIKDMVRRQTAAKREGATRTVSLDSSPGRNGDPAPHVRVAAKDPSPTSHVRAAELRHICREVLDGREYEVWLRIEQDGRSASEVAVELGTTSAAVRGVLHRARCKLLKRLVAQGQA